MNTLRASETAAPSPRARRVLVLASLAVGMAGVASYAMRSPVVAFGALLIVAAGLAIVRYPSQAVVGLLFVQPFHAALFLGLTTRAHLHLGPLAQWKDAMVAALLVRAAVARLLEGEPLELIFGPFERFIVLYIAGYAALFAASPSFAAAGHAFAYDVEGPALLLAIILLRPSRRVLWACAVAVIAAATLMGAAAIWEQASLRTAIYRWYGAIPTKQYVQPNAYRSGAFLTNPRVLGFYMAVSTPFAVGLLGAAKKRGRLMAAIAAATCAGGLIVTITRTAYIGGALGVLGAVAALRSTRRMRLALVGLLAVVGLTIVVPLIRGSNGSFVRPAEDSSKAATLRRSVNLIVDRPMGYGLGTTDFTNYRFPVAGAPGATESTYLSRALEGGLLGLLLYVTALFATSMRLVAARRWALAHNDRRAVALCAGALGAVLGIVGANLFLGVADLAVEYALWAPPAIAIAYVASLQRGQLDGPQDT